MGVNLSNSGEKEEEKSLKIKGEDHRIKIAQEKEILTLNNLANAFDYASIEIIGEGIILRIPIHHEEYTCGELLRDVRYLNKNQTKSLYEKSRSDIITESMRKSRRPLVALKSKTGNLTMDYWLTIPHK